MSSPTPERTNHRAPIDLHARARLVDAYSSGTRILRARRLRGGIGARTQALDIVDAIGARSKVVLRAYLEREVLCRALDAAKKSSETTASFPALPSSYLMNPRRRDGMTKQMAKRMKRIEMLQRRGDGRSAPLEGPASVAKPAAVASSAGQGDAAGRGRSSVGEAFLQRVRREVASAEAAGGCASAIAVDCSTGQWTPERWIACLDAVASTLVCQAGLSLTVDLLPGRRLVIFLDDAWEGDAFRLVRDLRVALRPYAPAFGTCALAPGMSALELIETALAKAERASAQTGWSGTLVSFATRAAV